MVISIATTHRFITSFGFSIIIETAVVALILLYILKKREISLQRIVIAGTFATMMTIPYVWFFFPNLFDWPRSTAILYAEAFAVIIEAVFYRLFLKISWRTAFVASLIANLASYLPGPILRSHGWWVEW